jgi:hypothetical protein
MNCARPLDPSDKFCSACGHKVTPHQASIERTTSDVQTALAGEIAKGRLNESTPIPEPPSPGAAQTKRSQTEGSLGWDYEKMSDEELQQLCTAYQRVQQQVPDSLLGELAVRESRRSQTHSIPSSNPTHTSPSTQLTTIPQAAIETNQPLTPVNRISAPYAKFVVQLLLACLCASVGVFAFFDASARNTSSFGVETLSVLLAVVFGWLGRTTYKVILRSESTGEAGRKRPSRKALVTSLVFIFLYLGLAALLGSVIGQNRADAIQLNVDIAQQKEIADRITKARTAVSDSISSYLDMYARIESDVQEYSSTLLRLKKEVYVYDGKFPDQADSMRKYASTIEKEIRRSDLLKKQIASAKQIASLSEYQQSIAWRSQMVPILEEEDALDKSN